MLYLNLNRFLVLWCRKRSFFFLKCIFFTATFKILDWHWWHCQWESKMFGNRFRGCRGSSQAVLPDQVPGEPQPGGQGRDGVVFGGQMAGLGGKICEWLCPDPAHLHKEVAILWSNFVRSEGNYQDYVNISNNLSGEVKRFHSNPIFYVVWATANE